MATILYASQTDLNAVLSSFGVSDRADDLDTSDDDDENAEIAANITACLDRASAEIDFVLCQRYSVAQFAPGGVAVRWVKWCCAILATIYLCQRRNNPVPEALQAEFEKYREALKQISTGEMQLIGDNGAVDPLFDDTPTVSNFQYNDWYRVQKIRRVWENSTGGPQSPGRKQFSDPYWYFPFS